MQTRTAPSEPHSPSELHGAEDILDVFVDVLDAAWRRRSAPLAVGSARPRPVAPAPSRERKRSRV
jgi:hypothetical protein